MKQGTSSTPRSLMRRGTYYYGARYYDPKTSIWLSVDPMAEKFPSWSSYNYTLLNPVIYTDPTGMAPEDIIIKGSKEFKNQAFANLQSLTDDTLEIDKSGKVTVSETSCNSGCQEGGNLVSNLINKEDVTVEFNPNKTTGGVDVNGSKERPTEIGLGHELIHSQNRIDGKRDPKSSGVRDPDRAKGTGTVLSGEELKTRKSENKLRKERGVPLRKTKQ